MVFDLDEVLGRVKAAEDDDSRREIFMETLFDWGDFYSENLAGAGESDEALNGRARISDLWLAYATMESDLGGVEKATQVFADALEDPAASLVAATYSECAAHCMSSNPKMGPVEAARVFSLGLQKEGMPGDEIIKLRAAQATTGAIVKKEGGVDDDDLFSPTGGGDYKQIQSEAAADLFLAEMMRLNEMNRDGGEEEDNEEGGSGESTAGYTPEQLIKKYSRRPPLVFESDTLVGSAGVSGGGVSISPEDASLLESYLGLSLAADEAEFSACANGVMDVLEALWVTQAAKERMYSKWYADLQAAHTKELKMRDAAVGTSKDEAADNRVRARNRCAVQKEVLTAIVHKSMWANVQQNHRILIGIGFPSFKLATLEALEAHLHSGDASPTMPAALAGCLKQQSCLVKALLSRRKSKHADGTLPVAVKIDPRIARKRQREATAAVAREKEKEINVKKEEMETVGTAKPLTLASNSKVMPAPDAAALAKLAEQEAHPPKRTRKSTRLK